MSSQAKGSCHCGKVEIEAPNEAMMMASCHCESCQKLSSGGRLLAYITQSDSITVTGETRTYTYSGGSGSDIHMSFCPTCSTQIFATPTAHEGMAVIRATLLDNAKDFVPQKYIFTETAFPWENTE